MNLCEARSLLGRQPETRPLRRCASSSARSRRRARRGREAAVQTRPSRHLARLSLSTSQARGGLPKALTPLRGVPPIHGGLTSDPARRKVFQLEAAHGRGRRATPARGRVGAHSACAGHGPRERRAGAGGGESERSTVRRRAGSPVPPAARAAALTSPPARRQLTARPQRSLKAQHAGGATARPAPPHSPGPEAPRPGEDSLHPPLYGDLSLASCRTSALRGEGAHSCL